MPGIWGVRQFCKGISKLLFLASPFPLQRRGAIGVFEIPLPLYKTVVHSASGEGQTENSPKENYTYKKLPTEVQIRLPGNVAFIRLAYLWCLDEGSL